MCISDSSDHILTYISVQPVLQLCSKSTVLQIIQPAGETAAPGSRLVVRCSGARPGSALHRAVWSAPVAVARARSYTYRYTVSAEIS